MTDGETVTEDAFSVRLPADVTACRTARELLGDLLRQAQAEDRLVHEAQLVLHELVINGVLHGRSDAQGEITVQGAVVGGRLELVVEDAGTGGRIAVRPPTEDQDSGRGLAIVDALCESWTVDQTHGTRVSARIAL